MLLFLTNFNLSGSDIQRIGWDGENLTDTLTVYVDTIATGDYYLDMEDEAGNKNIIALLKDASTHTLHVDLTKEMIGAAGMKKLQMRLCSGEETIKKSNVISVFTGASINASEPFQHTSPSEFEEVERRVSEALQQAADYGVKGDKGDTGQRGPAGQDGADGVSPTVATSKSGKVTTITITDKNGEHTATINDGADGQDGAPGQDGSDGAPGADGADGVSPTVATSKSGKVTTITITDKNGEHTATINDGNDGQNGQNGQDGAAGADGDDGTTFTPAVSSAGVISWTNDGGKQNPQSVDIVAAVLAALPTWTGGAY